MTKQQRTELRLKFGGKCAYCGVDLPERGWHADHVKPVIRKVCYDNTKRVFVPTNEFYSPENNKHENLFPACAPCNIDKGSSDLDGWREYLNSRILEGLRRNSSTFRHAERFGRVVITAGPLVFWFEKFEANKMEKP